MLRGVLELLIFRILEDGDRYVFELGGLIAEYSGGLLHIQNATLYITLYRLRDRGYITMEERIVANRKRNYYYLNDSGREYYDKIKKEYMELAEGVRHAFEYPSNREE
jgi:DNA-binding PadR family transcriptional regulator